METVLLLFFHFNSTMVRLKDAWRLTYCQRNGKFQFHYGTIKRMKAITTLLRCRNFNSTMVRLKGTGQHAAHYRHAFQFHYGTIKRKARCYWCSINSKFQFHYGTIKRRKSAEEAAKAAIFQFHYGTIKRKMTPTFKKCEKYFNSTMVRLKVPTYVISRMFSKFQFHYGTIKRRVRQALAEIGQRNFNSTMVRLKVSHSTRYIIACLNFNSTMVRLKAEKGGIYMDLACLFQFHYGTIKSCPSCRPPVSQGISIPLWYD